MCVGCLPFLDLLSETHTCICSYFSLLTIAYDASLDHWYEGGKVKT